MADNEEFESSESEEESEEEESGESSEQSSDEASPWSSPNGAYFHILSPIFQRLRYHFTFRHWPIFYL